MGLLKKIGGFLGSAAGGNIVGAIGSLAGGLMSQDSNADAVRRQMQAQKEFAQNGIRWKVADAKAAGLHPLYALGAQPSQYSPVMAQDSLGPALADAGQNIGRALSLQQTKQERELQALALMQARRNLDETDARIGLLNSEAMRNRAEAASAGMPINITRPIPTFKTELGGNGPTAFGSQVIHEDQLRGDPGKGLTELAPTKTYTETSSGVGSGATPMFREFTLPGDMPILLPGGMQGDAAEALESLAESPLLLWAVYQENVRRYGPEWGRKFRERYFGTPIRDKFSLWFGDRVDEFKAATRPLWRN